MTRMECHVPEQIHARIEEQGRLMLRVPDTGEILYAVKGGEFDGEMWVHEVVKSCDVPVQ